MPILHAVLCHQSERPALCARPSVQPPFSAARKAILAVPSVVVSTVSIWEFAIKLSVREFRLDVGNALDEIARGGFERLPVEDRHCRHYAELPALHRDPFNRILSAETPEEALMLMSRDRHTPLYRDVGLRLMPCG